MKLTLINAATSATTTSPTITTEEINLKTKSEKSLSREAISIQATVVGTGSVTATVTLEGSNDLLAWVTLNTFTLSGTTIASDIAVFMPGCAHYMAKLTAITGTSAAATVTIGG